MGTFVNLIPERSFHIIAAVVGLRPRIGQERGPVGRLCCDTVWFRCSASTITMQERMKVVKSVVERDGRQSALEV